MRALESDAVLEGIDRYADKHFLHIVNREKARLLERLVKKHKPKLALETGTLVGYSAIWIARNLPASGRLVTVEVSKRRADEAVKNIAAAGLSGKVDVVVGDALDVMRKIHGRVDFVFFDVADYLACLEALEKNGCVGKGSIIVANNVKWFWSQLQGYIGHVRDSGKYKSSFHDFGFDGMEVSVRR